MKVEHHEWTTDSLPKKVGFHWHCWCEVERKPTEDGADGQIFHFSDIGYFDTERAAHERAICWAKAWIEENFEGRLAADTFGQGVCAASQNPFTRYHAMTISDDPANEVVIRPNEGAGWRVEFPDASREGGKFVTIVVHEQEALNLAAQLCPKAQVKIFHEPGKR